MIITLIKPGRLYTWRTSNEQNDSPIPIKPSINTDGRYEVGRLWPLTTIFMALESSKLTADGFYKPLLILTADEYPVMGLIQLWRCDVISEVGALREREEYATQSSQG